MFTVVIRLTFACLALDLIRGQGPSANCQLCDIRTCENETLIQASCPDAKLVSDRCGCCKVCGRKFGEPCGGAYEYIGKCEYGLLCTAKPSEYLNGVNISGVCTRKVCNKNCTKQALNRLCGDDGRWYRNKCALRQSKFCDRTGVSEASSLEVCDTACRDPKAPEHGNVSLSQGIAQGSVANYSCQPPYILQGSENRTCSGGPEAPAWNGTDVVCIDPCDLHPPCDNHKVCSWSNTTEPQCVCESTTQCLDDNRPVCASNGITYCSECHMRATACQTCLTDPLQCSGTGIYVINHGICPSKEDEVTDKGKQCEL